MGEIGQLKKVEKPLIEDLVGSAVPLEDLGKKYGVTHQAISLFAIKRGIKRPKREHTKRCSICQKLMIVAKRHPGEFISCQTLYKQLKLGRDNLSYHMGLLKKADLSPRTLPGIARKKRHQPFKTTSLPDFVLPYILIIVYIPTIKRNGHRNQEGGSDSIRRGVI